MPSMLHQGCQEKYYFYGCSSKSWHWGKLQKFLDVSFDNPRVSPCIHVPQLRALCAFCRVPTCSRARAPCPVASITKDDGVGGKGWLGKPFVYTSGAWRGSVFLSCFWCIAPQSCVLEAMFTALWLAVVKLSSTTVPRSLVQFSFGFVQMETTGLWQGVSGLEDSPLVFSFCLFLWFPLSSVLLLGMGLRIVLLSEPTVCVGFREFTWTRENISGHFVSEMSGKPQPALPSTFILAEVFVKAEIVYSSCL